MWDVQTNETYGEYCKRASNGTGYALEYSSQKIVVTDCNPFNLAIEAE